MSPGAKTIPEEVKATHRSLSVSSAAFLDLLESRPGFARSARVDDTALPDWFRAQYPMKAWPLLVEPPRLAELRAAPIELARLLKSVPQRVFDGDPWAIARFYGLDNGEMVAAMLEEPSGIAPALARGDFVDSEDGLRCLEFNMSSCLGGWQIRFFLDELLRQPWMADLLSDAPEFRLTDPLVALFEHLVGEAVAAGLADAGELNVALLVEAPPGADVRSPMSLAVSEVYSGFLRERHPGLGGALQFTGYDGVEERHGAIRVDGRPVQVVVEYHGPTTDPKVFRAFKAGRIHLYNGPVALLLRDKRNLALLSEHQHSDRFDAAEREVIRRLVPWTRVTRPAQVRFRGIAGSLPEIAVEARESLVLKPAVGSRGDSVLIGWQTPADLWAAAVETAFASGRWILQERVVSRPYWYPVDDGVAVAHDLIWGLFAFGERYGGGVLRMLPQDQGGVINNALGACLGLFLERE